MASVRNRPVFPAPPSLSSRVASTPASTAKLTVLDLCHRAWREASKITRAHNGQALFQPSFPRCHIQALQRAVGTRTASAAGVVTSRLSLPVLGSSSSFSALKSILLVQRLSCPNAPCCAQNLRVERQQGRLWIFPYSCQAQRMPVRDHQNPRLLAMLTVPLSHCPTACLHHPILQN